MPIITHRDVEAVTGLDLTPIEVERVNRYLVPNAEAELIALLNRDVHGGAVVGEAHSITCEAVNAVHLRQTPVLAISAYRIDGVAQDPGSYVLQPWGVLLGWSVTGWPTNPLPLEFDYTYGLANEVVSETAVKNTLAEAVGRSVAGARASVHAEAAGAPGSGGLRSLSVEGYSLTFADGGTDTASQFVTVQAATVGMFNPGEVNALSRFKRRVVR